MPADFGLPASGTGLAELKKYVWWQDLVTNGFAVLAICLGGVLTLWVPNPVWGSAADMITAALAAATAQYVFGKEAQPAA